MVKKDFDRCLGCLACVTACPSGVRYDRLIERTRAQVEDEVDRPLGDRFVRGLLFRLLPYPGRMRAALTLAPIGRALPMPGRLRPLAEVAPRWRGHGDRRDRDSLVRTATRTGRSAHGLRPARGLSRRERRDRARAGGGRVRGRRSAAGLLRRALGARGPARRREGVRARTRRRIRRTSTSSS